MCRKNPNLIMATTSCRVFSRLDDIACLPHPSHPLWNLRWRSERIELRSVGQQNWAWTKTCSFLQGLVNHKYNGATTKYALWFLSQLRLYISKPLSKQLNIEHETRSPSLLDLLRKKLLFSRITRESEWAVDDFYLPLFGSSMLGKIPELWVLNRRIFLPSITL